MPPKQTYPGQTYPGQTDAGRAAGYQTYPGQTYPGQTYPGQTDAGRAAGYLWRAGLIGRIPDNEWLPTMRAPNPDRVPWYYSQWLLWMERP